MDFVFLDGSDHLLIAAHGGTNNDNKRPQIISACKRRTYLRVRARVGN